MEGLCQSAYNNLSKSYSQQLKNGEIKIVCGDGRNGYIEEAPYDAINVGAGAFQIPKALIDQLKVGGKLIIPVGDPNND